MLSSVEDFSMTEAAVNKIMGSGLFSEDPSWLEGLPLVQWDMSRDDWRQALSEQNKYTEGDCA